MKKIFAFDAVIEQLIRPVRFTYSIADLGPAIFAIN